MPVVRRTFLHQKLQENATILMAGSNLQEQRDSAASIQMVATPAFPVPALPQAPLPSDQVSSALTCHARERRVRARPLNGVRWERLAKVCRNKTFARISMEK